MSHIQILVSVLILLTGGYSLSHILALKRRYPLPLVRTTFRFL